ncbi:MAG: hypothetical protein AAFQ94_30785 [Bacteroidota bacterium]
MELVNTNEDLLVMECLEKMKANAEAQALSGNLISEKGMWLEHLEVIKKAIEATRKPAYLSKKTA